MRRTAGILAVALVAVLAGCSDDGVDVGGGATTTAPPATNDGSVPDRTPEISGTITTVAPFVPITEDCTPADEVDPDGAVSSEDPPICTDPDNDVLGTVLVEEQPKTQDGRKISFTVRTSTTLAGVDSFDDLAKGQTVEGWTPGPCAESYPEQCTAEALRVTS